MINMYIIYNQGSWGPGSGLSFSQLNNLRQSRNIRTNSEQNTNPPEKGTQIESLPPR